MAIGVDRARIDLVRSKAESWADDLIDFGPNNTLLYYPDSKKWGLGLTGAAPDAVTQLLAGRKDQAGHVGTRSGCALLVARVRQSQLSEANGSYLLALFGIGSFVEGLLFSVLIRRCPELAQQGFTNRNGRKVAAGRAGLELLIDTAHDRGLIQLDAKNFMHPVRDFRNYIHPRRQLETEFTPDGDTVAMCWPSVQALLNDLDTAADVVA